MNRLYKVLILVIGISVLGVSAQAEPSEGVALGIEQFEDRRFDEAEKTFKAALQKNSKDAIGHHYLGRVKFEKGEFAAAQKQFLRSIELDARDADSLAWLGWTTVMSAEEASMFKAMSLAKSGRSDLERALEMDPRNPVALRFLGEYYLGAPGIAGGSVDKARLVAQRLRPMDEVGSRTLLLQIHEKEKSPTDLLEEYKGLARTIGDAREHSGFYNRYGYFLLNLERFDEAVIQFETQARLRPESANPHDSLGDGYLAAGRLQEARRSYQRALAIDPEFSSSAKNLARVEKELQKVARN